MLPYIDLCYPLPLSSILPYRILEAETRRQLQREGVSTSDTLSFIRDNDGFTRFAGNNEAYDNHDPCYVFMISDTEPRQLPLEILCHHKPQSTLL